MERARGLQLARYGRLQLAFTAVTLFSASLCLWAFGLPWTALLLCCGATSYNLLSHFCYQPEGREWRAKLERSYSVLFRYLFGASASPAPPGVRVRPPGRRSRAGTPTGASREPQVSALCHKEAQKVIDLITRDFISDWYKDVTGDVEFPDEVQKILEHIALEVDLRLQNVDLNETVCELLALVLPYLEAVNEAGSRDHDGIRIFDVENEKCLRAFKANPGVSHRALKSPEAETAYYRQGLDALIQVAVPAEYRNCDVARTFVREILLENVLVPLLDLLCDPDFIYEAIPLILDKAQPEKIQRELAEIERENEQLERQQQRRKMFLLTRRNTHRKRFWSLSGRFAQSAAIMTPLSVHEQHHSPKANRRASVATESPSRHSGSNMEVKRHPSIPFHKHLTGKTEQLSEAVSSEYQPLPVERKPKALSSAARAPPLSRQKTSPPELYGLPPPMHPRERPPPPLMSRSHTVDVIPSGDRERSATPELGVDVIEEEEEEIDDDMVHIDLPPVCVKHHVTVNAGGSSHIGYIFEFPKWMLSDVDLKELGVMQNDTHLEAMKRYSEFVTFHNKLLRSELATYAKSCDLPDRKKFTSFVSKLSFSGLDPTVILERKEGLERYIQSISAVKAVRESKLFCEFLKSGVEVLREAAVISPQQRASGGRKRNLFRIMKGHTPSDDAAVKASPKRPMDTVLSSYLNTHLPLPCQSLHSLHSIHLSPSPTLRDRLSPSTSSLSPSEVERSQTTAESSLDTFTTARSGSSTELSGNLHDVDSLRPRSSSSPARGDSICEVDEGSRDGLGPRVKRSSSSADSVCLRSQSSAEDGSTAGIGTLDRLPLLCHGDKSETETTLCSGPELPPNGYETKIPPVKSDDTVTLKEPDSPSVLRYTILHCKLFYAKLVSWFLQVVFFLKYIFNQGYLPITHANTYTLYNERQQSTPLANVLLSLATEGSKSSCPELWATSKGSQLVLLSLLGGAIDQFLWKELHEVVHCEENWIRAVYHLRHTLWPDGKLDTSPRRKRSEEEKAKAKVEAAESFKRFLPDFLPYLVGHTDYDRAVKHCLECLQNPKINRHFFLAVIDLLLTKMVPEIQGKDFQRHLARMRAIKLVSSQRRRIT